MRQVHPAAQCNQKPRFQRIYLPADGLVGRESAVQGVYKILSEIVAEYARFDQHQNGAALHFRGRMLFLPVLRTLCNSDAEAITHVVCSAEWTRGS